ncbi:hypothetical protein TIFTF001_002250 [Ficus carica]|uniref:Uncharacterized protein n=1 Tax=Ficus carica TaxID=3494 RepID=A0AA87ZA39_FICCA|nr:hypothetical protein TIFTF001_002250 [Ficus carica]
MHPLRGISFLNEFNAFDPIVFSIDVVFKVIAPVFVFVSFLPIESLVLMEKGKYTTFAWSGGNLALEGGKLALEAGKLFLEAGSLELEAGNLAFEFAVQIPCDRYRDAQVDGDRDGDADC